MSIPMTDGYEGFSSPIVIYVHDGMVKAVLNSSSNVTPVYVVFHLDTDPEDGVDMFDIPLPDGSRAVAYVYSEEVFPLNEDVEDAAWAFIEGHVNG